LTCPFDTTHAFLAVGSPGVSLGNVDGGSAMAMFPFKQGTWHALRLRVTRPRISFFVDEKPVLDVPTVGHALALPPTWDVLKAFGIGTWQTTGALRNIRVRRLGE